MSLSSGLCITFSWTTGLFLVYLLTLKEKWHLVLTLSSGLLSIRSNRLLLRFRTKILYGHIFVFVFLFLGARLESCNFSIILTSGIEKCFDTGDDQVAGSCTDKERIPRWLKGMQFPTTVFNMQRLCFFAMNPHRQKVHCVKCSSSRGAEDWA